MRACRNYHRQQLPVVVKNHWLQPVNTAEHTTIATDEGKSAIDREKPWLRPQSLITNGHSPSAQLIYDLIAEICRERDRETVRIGTKDLLARTPIRSHVTVRKAIDELMAKLSLEIVEANQGKIPPLYRVKALKDILRARKQAQLEIDEDTGFAFQKGLRIWPPAGREGDQSDRGTPGHTASHTASVTATKTEAINDKIAPPGLDLSAICGQLDVEIDSASTKKLAVYPQAHVIIGICRTVAAARKKGGKKALTLADRVAAIAAHYEAMKAMPEAILAQVAYDSFARLVDASEP